MPTHALILDGQIVQLLTSGQPIVMPDTSVVMGWSEGSIDGGYVVAPIGAADAIPSHKEVASTSVELVGGMPRWVHVLHDRVISPSYVNAERDRRIVAGKTFDGVAVTGRAEDMRNLTNLALAAQLRIASGDNATLTRFRDGNDVYHNLTPTQMLAIWQQGTAYASDIYAASWVIKDLVPIPLDYDDDSRWPG